MSEASKNSWDSLADEIGARPNEASEQPAPTAKAPEPEPEYQEPTRPASGWDNLLGEFGIDAPAPVAPQPAPTPKAETVAPPAPPVEEEAAEAQEQVIEEPALREAVWDNAFGEVAEVVDAAPAEAKPAESEPFEPEPQADEAVAEAEPEEASPPPSKWDMAPKAQLTLPDWFPFAGKRSKPPVAPPVAEKAVEPTPAEPAPVEVKAVESAPEVDEEHPSEAIAELSDSVETEAESSEKTEQEGEGRGRRRRRRGRRRRGSAEAESPATAEEEAVEAVEEGAAALDQSSEGIEDDQDEAGDHGESDGRVAPRHRSVPSWTDAIGVVVDANIAARSDRQKANSRGGTGRGRRGGRRRGRKTSS